MQKKTMPIEQMTYEQAMQDLEITVAALEETPPSLEEAIALFERGQALARRCTALLDQAELKVRQLTAAQMEE